ncbi:MAG: sulfotransferase, partial [Pseudomonadota bacterium]
GQVTLVTKRAHGWWRDPDIAHLVDKAGAEDMGIILMVRDPRDVLLSAHGADPKSSAYVSPLHWARSIRAGAALERRLDEGTAFMILRYEDLVTAPEETGARIAARFGLTLRAGSPGFAAVGHNLAASGAVIDDYLVDAMHGVRTISGASVGKWRERSEDPAAALVADPDTAPLISAFCGRHDYAGPEPTSM